MKKYLPEIFGILLCLAIGSIGGAATHASDYQWYATLVKPAFNPPNYIFAPVWSILYVMIGIVFGKVWRLRKQHPFIFIVFILQLIINALWSVFFFQQHNIGLAVIDILLLWLSIGILIAMLRPYSRCYWLLLPYWAWVSFASVLNISIYFLN